jgi:Zn finger protein HypA/HybF involved in hydrogenase expression
MKVVITLRMWIEAALQFADAKCEDCFVPLEQVWIGDDQKVDLHYIHCPQCQTEYSFSAVFYPVGENKDA